MTRRATAVCSRATCASTRRRVASEPVQGERLHAKAQPSLAPARSHAAAHGGGVPLRSPLLEAGAGRGAGRGGPRRGAGLPPEALAGGLSRLLDLAAPGPRLAPAPLDELLEAVEVALQAPLDEAELVAGLLHHALGLRVHLDH